MSHFKIRDCVALVTGANRGIGKAYAEELLRQGARKVYLGVRKPDAVRGWAEKHGERAIVLELDVTNPDHIRRAAEKATDVTLLLNNAGLAHLGLLSDKDRLLQARQEMEVNYFGPLMLCQAFAPHLRRNQPSAIVNVSSIGGQVLFPAAATYCASKFAVHALTQALRMEHLADGIRVLGVYPGPIDTDMARSIDLPKEKPESVARETFRALEEGRHEVFPDSYARETIKAFRADPAKTEDQMIRAFGKQRAA